MASKAFMAALASTKQSKNLDTILVGSSHIQEGTHDVVIQAVDTSAVTEKNKFVVTYATEDGKTYVEHVFMLNYDNTEMSFGLRAMLSALIPDTAALAQLLDTAVTDDSVFETLTGMQVRITLQPGKGFQCRTTGNGTFAAFDTVSGEMVSEEYADIKEARMDAEAKGLKRSYLRVVRSECTHKESNLAAFATAIESRKKAGGGSAGLSKIV